jgi:hypothetical protein
MGAPCPAPCDVGSILHAVVASPVQLPYCSPPALCHPLAGAGEQRPRSPARRGPCYPRSCRASTSASRLATACGRCCARSPSRPRAGCRWSWRVGSQPGRRAVRSSVRLPSAPLFSSRGGVTKGAGSRTKGLLMAYKLLDMAQARWRRLNGAHLLPLVRAGIGSWTGCSRKARSTGRKRKRRDHATPTSITYLTTSRSTIVYRSSSSSSFAPVRSRVSKPSVNQA